MQINDLKQLELFISTAEAQFEYDVNDNVVYAGYLVPGTLTSEAKAVIIKFTYDASFNVLTKRYAQGVLQPNFEWDERATYDYIPPYV